MFDPKSRYTNVTDALMCHDVTDSLVNIMIGLVSGSV